MARARTDRGSERDAARTVEAKPVRAEVRGRGELELEVLTTLAAADAPMTAAQVQAEIGGGIAYTTVMTTLARLYDKSALDRSLLGRAYTYALVGGTATARSNMTAHQMLKLLDEGTDRAGVLTRFVADLSPADEKLLARLIDPASDRPGRSRRPG